MKTHLFTTGHVRLTRSWREGNGDGVRRLINSVIDPEVTEWLPIYCCVVEHSDGLIVVDTGIPEDANAPIYFPPHMRLVQRAAPFAIAPSQEIGDQMRAAGLNPADVRWVVLTHLHQDHDGGIHHFPNAEFMVSRTEWAAAQGFSGRMNGYLNRRWFSGFAPTLIDFEDDPFYSFPSSKALTANGDIRLVPTPGHSAGHVSVVVEQTAHILFLAGDATYSQSLLLNRRVDGIGTDVQAQRETHRRILSFAAQVPLVLVPTHDPDAAERLELGLTLRVEQSSSFA